MNDNYIIRYKELQKNAPLWKKEMYAAYCQVERQGSYDILGLYIKLEQIFNKYYQKGEVDEGVEFYIEMGEYLPLKLIFYDNATEMYMFNNDTHQEKLILSKNDSAHKEYSKLYAYEAQLELDDFKIGRRYPESLRKYLAIIEPGQIIAFEEGNVYVCRGNTSNTVYLQEVFSGDVKSLTSDSFRKNKEKYVTVDFSDKISIQAFYRKNKKQLTHSVERKFLDVRKAQMAMKKIYGSLPLFMEKKVTFGPITLRVKKSLIKKNTVLWREEKGKILSEGAVRYLIGYLYSTPSETMYNRKNPTDLKFIEDEAFAQDIEAIMQKHNFEEALSNMMEYVMKNKNDLSINTIAYECNDENQILAVSYTFKEIKGQCKIFKVIFVDADFQSDIKEIKEVAAEEFYNFCKKKYTKGHNILN